MADVRFLDQANLNRDLYDFLVEMGYPEKSVKFILSEGRINNSTPREKTRDDYFDRALYEKINEKEKLLFRILNTI